MGEYNMNKEVKMFIEENKESWNISLCGEFKDKIMEQLLEDDIPKIAADKIFYNAVNILSHCPDPSKKEKNGKTRNSNRKSTKW
jgi:hypothetical protein